MNNTKIPLLVSNLDTGPVMSSHSAYYSASNGVDTAVLGSSCDPVMPGRAAQPVGEHSTLIILCEESRKQCSQAASQAASRAAHKT